MRQEKWMQVLGAAALLYVGRHTINLSIHSEAFWFSLSWLSLMALFLAAQLLKKQPLKTVKVKRMYQSEKKSSVGREKQRA